MKNLFTLLIGIILFVTANAQTPELNWAKSFNGKSASTDSTSIMKMNIVDKSIYIAGTSDAYGKANDIVLIKRNYASGDIIWTRNYNGSANDDDQAVDMVINQTTGDIYVTGKSTGISTGYDVVTLKYSADGVLVWTKIWDNSNNHGDDIPKAIGIDNIGIIYISGITYNGDINLEDLLVLAYSSSGTLKNSDINELHNTGYTFPPEYSKDFVAYSKVNNIGNVFICGEYMLGEANNGLSEVFVDGLTPFSSSFKSLFSSNCVGMEFDLVNKLAKFPHNQNFTSPDDFNFFNAMDLDNTNNVYLAYLNDKLYGTGTNYTIGISKISSSGCTIWESKYGSNSNYKNLRVNSIKADSNGNVYAAGYEKNSNGDFDWFVIKYNSSGVLQWRSTKKGTGNGNDIPNDLTFDNLQNPVVVGVTKNAGTNNDIAFVKYNKTNGAELFSVYYDSTNGDDKAYNIIVDASQRIIINGIENTATQSQNMITLMYCNTPATPTISLNGNALHSDAISGNQWYNKNEIIDGATTQDYTPKTSGDYYVIVSDNGCNSKSSNTLNFIPTGIAPNESAKTIKVYPNPVTNELTIEFEGNTTKSKFEIINSLGQSVFNGTIIEKTVVQTSSFSQGIYIIKLESGKTSEFKKVIKK